MNHHTIKELLLDIQDHLASCLPELWTDKDWGQLQFPQPPVKFPCALLDVESITFSSLERGGQMADVNIVLTVANQRLKPTSSKAPDKQSGYLLLDIIESIHLALQLHHAEWYAPLVRKDMRKLYIDNTTEVYSVTYGTAFKQAEEEGKKLPSEPIKIRILEP